MNNSSLEIDAIHIKSGLVKLLKKDYFLSEQEGSIVEEAALYENQWALIGDAIIVEV